MTRDPFARALALILSFEGLHSNDPNDHGGATYYGLAQSRHPEIDVSRLTLERASAIYEAQYWNAVRCPELPWIFALPLFDAAVNQGQGASVKDFQEALGVRVDGDFGAKTMARAHAVNDQRDVLTQFLVARADRYRMNPHFRLYGDGWMHRLFAVAQDAVL